MPLDIIPILIAIILVSLFALLLMFLPSKSKRSSASKSGGKNKDTTALIRNASKKLAQNPRDTHSLLIMGDYYYQQSEWEKAERIYSNLLDLCMTNTSLDKFEIALRDGVCKLKLNKNEEAMKSLFVARSIKRDNFEVCYNLGYLHYKVKEYEKAISILRQAVLQNQEHGETLKYLGLALHKTGKNRDALNYLKRAVDLLPQGNKDALFAMGECFNDMGAYDRALKIFTHLRADPEYGPQSSLYAGIIHTSMSAYDQAVSDFEIALKHQNLKPEIHNEVLYRMGIANLKQQNISQALQALRTLQSRSPGYKDTQALINRYQEMNANRNLQTYLLAGQGDFVTLCRKIVFSMYSKSRIKIVDIQATHDYTDILADIENSKWQDVIMFRFFRSTGSTGELILRDFHAKLKDTKAGKGFCITAGTFTPEAKHFVEARLIDLIEKDKLNVILNKVDTNKPETMQ